MSTYLVNPPFSTTRDLGTLHRNLLQGIPLTGNVTVTTASTVVLGPLRVGTYRIWIKNTGATALNSFKIQARNSSTSTWKDLIDTFVKFTLIPEEIAGFLIASDNTISPTNLAATAEWDGAIDSKAYKEVRVVASVASGSTVITYEVS